VSNMNARIGNYSLLGALGAMREIVAVNLREYNSTAERIASPKLGFYGSLFTTLGAQQKVPLSTILFGEVPMEKAVNYRHHAQEKGCRLGDNLSLGHVSSYQSADIEGKDTYPGAILAGDYILSGSGLYWKRDEVITLTLGLDLKILTMDKAKIIATISQNELFFRSL